MKSPEELFESNRRWAESMRGGDPGFFETLRRGQSPAYLWIGCSDSRVPACQVVGLRPGELFVHRNIANLVAHSDLNGLSVLQYAVDALRVRHIIVCGHHGCGGVKAAVDGDLHGLTDHWLRPIRELARRHAPELAALPDEQARLDRLCELNVVEQVAHVAGTTIVEQAWARGQPLSVHGWIYGLGDGRLRDLGVRWDGPVPPRAG